MNGRPTGPGGRRAGGWSRVVAGCAVAVAILAAAIVGGCAGASEAESRALARWVETEAADFAGPRPERIDDPADADAERTTAEQRQAMPDLAEFIDEDEPVNADALVAYALAHNPGLKAAFDDWKAALERVPQARALMDPQVSYSHFVDQMMMRQTVGLSQTFEWYDKLVQRGEVATAEARAAEQRFERRRLEVAYEVADAWAEWAHLQQATAVVRENKAILEQFIEAAEAAFEAGARPFADVLRAELEVGQITDELESLENSRSAIAGRLNAAMGRRSDAPLPKPADLPAVALEVEEPRLLDWLEQSNPELAALAAEITGRREQVRLARMNWIPDLTVRASYQDGVTERGDAVEVGFGVNLPIWRDRLDAERAEALAGFGAATHRRTDELNELEAAVRMAHYRFRDADRRAKLYQDELIPSARQALEATQAAYGEGRVEYQALTQAQTTLQAFKLTYERARMERFQRLAELEMLVGRPLDDGVAERQPTPPSPEPDAGGAD